MKNINKIGLLGFGLAGLLLTFAFQNCSVRRLEGLDLSSSVAAVGTSPSGSPGTTAPGAQGPVVAGKACYGVLPSDFTIDGGLQNLKFQSIYAIVSRSAGFNGVGASTSISVVMSDSCFDPAMANGGTVDCPKGTPPACQPAVSGLVSLSITCAANNTATTCTNFSEGKVIDYTAIGRNDEGLFSPFQNADLAKVSAFYSQNANVCNNSSSENFMIPTDFASLKGSFRFAKLTELKAGEVLEFIVQDLELKTATGKKVVLNGTLRPTIIELAQCKP